MKDFLSEGFTADNVTHLKYLITAAMFCFLMTLED